MGVVDFYTSRGPDNKERAIGTASKRVSWLSKWFWECWFEVDNVHLHGSRRGMWIKCSSYRLPRVQNGHYQELQWTKQLPGLILHSHTLARRPEVKLKPAIYSLDVQDSAMRRPRPRHSRSKRVTRSDKVERVYSHLRHHSLLSHHPSFRQKNLRQQR